MRVSPQLDNHQIRHVFKALDVESDGILTLPDAICAIPTLQHLTLGLPGLKTLPSAFGQLPGLVTLSLAGSIGLTALWQQEGCKLSSLRYLELPDAPATRQLPEGVLPE